jgi:hypothetical protein
LSENSIAPGKIFCSTETIKGTKNVYTDDHVTLRIIPPFQYDEKKIYLKFHTHHFVAVTGKLELSKESVVSVIAGIHEINDEEIVVRPLIIGAPSYDHPLNNDCTVDLIWHGLDWYQIFPHDIKEFEKILTIDHLSSNEWTKAMRALSEEDVKKNFCEILGDIPKKDWGGEQDDHFTASLHLGEQRKTGAFLLKGPAQFREMTPDMLGKRADQIYRLSTTPADILIVQHCHQIGEAVRATLRAFAVIPHNPRHYCFIDGKDTYKIFKAYGKI